jgi:SAM-dependent methyltransferase
MYRLATGTELWRAIQNWPEVFASSSERQALKPTGHAMVLDYIERQKPSCILEVGHGSQSPTFDVIHDRHECWGLDAYDQDRTVPTAALDRFRTRYPTTTFRNGYLGSGVDLPDNHFDMAFTVSVIEHLPVDQRLAFHQEMFRVLKPGGVQLHSYDVPFGADVAAMHAAIEQAGFEWIEPGVKPADFWTSAMTVSSIGKAVFEHPNTILTKFSHAIPKDKRTLWNWTTVFVGARKPV